MKEIEDWLTKEMPKIRDEKFEKIKKTHEKYMRERKKIAKSYRYSDDGVYINCKIKGGNSDKII